jgi:hypothetical protein
MTLRLQDFYVTQRGVANSHGMSIGYAGMSRRAEVRMHFPFWYRNSGFCFWCTEFNYRFAKGGR